MHADKSTVALKADKGNAMVLLDSTSYHLKATTLNDEAFCKLKKDPSGKIERTLTKLLKETDWADNIKTALFPRVSVPPKVSWLITNA